MQTIHELKRYMDFTSADEALLKQAWPLVQTHVAAIVDHFYEKTLASSASSVFESQEQVERLKQSMAAWIESLMCDPMDDRAFERQCRVGRRHVEVGLSAHYVHAAMSVLVDDLNGVLRRNLDGEILTRTQGAVHRAAMISLAIMVGTYIEDREQRKLNTLQDLIVSNLPMTILLLDDERRVTSGTATGTQLFGTGDLGGLHLGEVLPAELIEDASLDEQIDRALDNQREVTLLRVDTTLDGRSRNFSISIVPLDHPLAKVLLSIEELTRTIETEARLRHSETLAQLGTFSAAVAHELRNPLAGISGAIQVIASSLDQNDRRRPIMAKVKDQVTRMSDVVSDLLDLARPAEPDMTFVDLEGVARGALEVLGNEFAECGVVVRGTGRGMADPAKLHRVLLNLVQNACQAMDGSGEVVVEVADGKLSVTDTGPGVPVEERESIFEPFYTTRTRGTGLGLAICRQVCDAMGARLSVDRSYSDGARFVVELAE